MSIIDGPLSANLYEIDFQHYKTRNIINNKTYKRIVHK